MKQESTTLEKIGLLVLALISLIILGWVGIAALKTGKVDPNASALIGVIVTGLIAFSKDIIQAIRGYSMSAQLGKVTDQLAASGPVSDAAPVPQDAQEAAQQVAGAAEDAKNQITGE